MRTIFRIFGIGVVAIAVCTSCSVTRVVRESRTTDVTGKIMQMPTVSDLEVDDTPVRGDTTWRKVMFDGKTVSKKQITSNVIAGLLDKYKADVLVEPKVSHESTGNIFASDNKLTVVGYPARFTNFRSATLDDIKVMNELNNKPVVSNIVINNGVGIQPSGLAKTAKRAVRVAKKKAKRVRPEENTFRSKGYRGYVELGGAYNINEETGSFHVSTTHGYMFNPYLFLGGGIAYDFTEYSYYGSYATVTYAAHCLQVYADFKAYMSKSKFAPFADVKLGSSSDVDGESFMFFGFGLGFATKGFELACNYNYLGAIDSHLIGVTVGWSF